MNLIDPIKQSAFQNAAAPAFLSNGGVTTYREFYSLLCRAAKTLHAQGVRPGDMVGLAMEQSPMHCVAMLALARLGAPSISIHLESPPSSWERVVAKFGIRAIVSLNGLHSVAGIKSIRLDGVEAGADGGDADDMEFTAYAPDAATPFRISLTSGTSGEPKGDLLSHADMSDRIERTLYGTSCDRNSRVMPSDINSTMGLSLSIGVLMMGATLVFPKSYLSRDRMEAINHYSVTHAFFSQWAVSQMLSLLPDQGAEFPSLKHLRLVGSACSEQLLKAIRSKLTPHVFISYGLTEIGPVALATPEILAAWPHSTGRILPWMQVEALDEAGQVLPPGTSGEIRLKLAAGPTGYYKDEAETERKFRDGWFYTGDLGRVTEDGLLFIEGRIDEIINLGGYKVTPSFVEEVLARHPQVAEAAAFAMDGEATPLLAAALIPRGAEIDIADVAGYAKQELGWGLPKRFFVMQEFPRTLNGKLMRKALAAAALKMAQDDE